MTRTVWNALARMRTHRRPAAGGAPRARLLVESLEDRLVLSTIHPAFRIHHHPHHPVHRGHKHTKPVLSLPVSGPITLTPAPLPIHLPPIVLLDPILAKYESLGGPGGFLGKSLSAEMPTPTGGGLYEAFQGGNIYWSQATGAHVVYGLIGVEYAATANEHDAYGNVVQKLLGLPTSDEMNVPGVPGARMNSFQGGSIYWSQTTGAHVVYGAIGGEYAATANEQDAGGRPVQAVLGLPTGDEADVPGVPGARVTPFQGGAIYWSPGTGAHVVYGQIWGEYQATAGEHDANGNVVQADLGLPTADEADVPGQQGGRVSTFQGGAIYWSPTTGAHVLYGAIDAKYNSLGGPVWFGLPTGDETTTPDGTGRFNHFEKVGPGGGALAAIDWTPATGAHEVHGAIAAEFASLGWEKIGEAITDQIDIASFTYLGSYNRFQLTVAMPWPVGSIAIPSAIDWTAQTGAYQTHGPEYSDIQQGGAATCWIDASIAALESSGVDLSRLIQYEGNNTYAVSLSNFNDPNNRQGGGMHPETQTVFFDGGTYGADLYWNANDPSQSWALILQRAVIQAVSEWDPSQSIQHPHSGSADDPLSILTGRTSSWVGVGDGSLQQKVEDALSSGKAVALDTLPSGTKTLVPFHYYAVLSASNQGLTLYNPYGTTQTVSWDVISQDGNGFMIC